MSVYEEIINGTYKRKKQSVYDSIINGTYETRNQIEERKKQEQQEKVNKISNYQNIKETSMKQAGTQFKQQNEIRRNQEEIINNEIKKQANEINNNFNKENSQNIQVPISKSISSNIINNNPFENYRNTVLKETSKKILPTNVRLSTAEEKNNFKELKKGDMYKLSDGAVDDRTNQRKVLDNTTAIIGNAGVGAVNSLANIGTYEDKSFNLLSRMIARKVTGTEELGDFIGNVAYDKIGRNLLTNGNSEKYKKDALEYKKWANKTIQDNINRTDNAGTKKIAELATSVGENIIPMAVSSFNPVAGSGLFMTSAAGGYYDDAINRGMNENQAWGYATVMGGLEGGSEAVISGKMLSKVKSVLIGKGLSQAFLNSLGTEIAENFAQEAVMEPLSEGTATLIGGKETADWNNIVQRSVNAGIDGILSAILLKGVSLGIGSANNVIDKINNDKVVTQNDIKNMMNDLKTYDKTGYEQTVQGAVKAITEKTQNNIQQENKTSQNQTSEEINSIPTDRYDISAKKYNIDTKNETVQSIKKVTEQRGINTTYNAEIFKDSTTNAIWRTTTDNNGNTIREVILNPKADTNKTLQNVIVHELTHDFEGTKEYTQLADIIMKNVTTKVDYETARKALEETYSKVYDKNNSEFKNLVDQEAVADVLGNKLGNQEFVSNLTMEQPSISKRIYNWVIDKLNKITGYSNERIFWTDVKNKFENAYRQDYKENNNNSKYSIQTDNNGNKYVKVDTDQDIFNGIAEKDYNKIAKMYMQDYLKGKTNLSENDSVSVGNKGISKYTNPKQTTRYMTEKMKLSTELKNALEIAQKDSISAPTKDTSKYPKWEYYKFNFELGGKNFEGTINIGIDKDGNKHFYEINKIHFTGISSVSTNSQHKVNLINENHTTSNLHISASKSSSMDFINNSIAPTKNDVNTNTKYSMQESENNTPNNKWKEFLDENYKNTGTGETIKDVKLPPVENKTTDKNNINVPIKYNENENLQEFLTDKDYEVLNKIYEKEGKTEILTEKKKASLLEKYINDKFTMKDSLDVLAQKFINKGHYVDQLAEKTKNPELKFMYDRNLNSFAEGQYVVGVAQTNNKGEKIGKSINEIWEPVESSNLTKEFSEYLLHKHNIDRSERGKFVFGEEIGPAESTKIALDYEKKHPEFKRWSQEIKNFNHNNLLNMKDAGLITEDTIKYIETMYPNYITIARNNEKSTYTGNNDRTGTLAPIKRATGGNADIQPLKDTMAQQAIRIKRLINQNKLGQELAKSLKNAKVIENNSETIYAPSMLMELDTLVDTDTKGNKYYNYFEDGLLQKLKINDNLYESLKPTQISKLENTLPLKIIQKATNIHRALLTTYNIAFGPINFLKDFQDGAFNSKYSNKFVKNFWKALKEIHTKGKYYESYMSNGGMNNSYYDYNEGIKKKPNKFVEKIRKFNEYIEQLPRLSEFISTLEDGKSLNEALYNAAEITTNFKRGGDITKALNRNGANFLNASIQGFDKQWRNFSGQNGAKGYANLLLKATIMGVVPAALNHILLDDDKDYQDLSESTKDLYYLFKYDDGKFIRIPKGRVISIFGAAARRTIEMSQGEEDAWKGFGDTVINQVAPNNPLEDNILAPIIAVKNNKTWYGSDLVSSRLQEELPKNQYDETTDNLSKWLGEKLNKSPKKINYLLDQYTGGIGDVLLPIITPQAKKNVFVDKFTTDSVLKNKNVSKFYETLEKQTQIVNDSFATDEDEVQLKYLNSISKNMGKLYKEKREIQMSNISNKEKTDKVREIQEKINLLAEQGLNNYKNADLRKDSATIDTNSYYKNGKGEWTTLTEEEQEKNKDIKIETYTDYKNKLYTTKQEKIESGELTKKQDLKNKDKIQILLDSNYSTKEIASIYENYIKSSKDTQYDIMQETGIDIKEYLKYKQQEFESDRKDDGTINGKAINKSKQKKEYEYVNNMKINYNQKLLLLGMQYSLTSSEKTKLANYVNDMELTKKEKLEIYEKLQGFKVYKDGRVTW